MSLTNVNWCASMVVVDLNQQHFGDDFRIDVTDSGQSGNCFDCVARATRYLEG